MEPSSELVDQIVLALRADGQFTVVVPGDHGLDVASEVAAARQAGRRAGRRLKWKIQTIATNPNLSPDGSVQVVVVVTDSSPLHQQLMEAQDRKAMRRAMAASSVRWVKSPSA